MPQYNSHIISNKETGTDVRIRITNRVRIQDERAIVRVRLIEIATRVQGRAVKLAVVGDQKAPGRA